VYVALSTLPDTQKILLTAAQCNCEQFEKGFQIGDSRLEKGLEIADSRFAKKA
jgi:hypothetical protein